MDAEFAFRGLEPFKLSGVTVSEQGMGQDGYGTPTDLELDYRGLKCVGKMAFELLLLEEELVQKFKENCLQLSKLRHPNIVQFLGIFFQEGITAPILVTEFLPITLSFCIDQYGRLPEEISFSILHDVALGLSYLHSQMPALFHGNLSSNTVLLDTNMKAKLSDLGTLSLTPLQITHVTQSPEAMVYVPPEAITSDPKFNVSIDVYAYGILMVHVFSGKWPNITTNDSADEANRRDQFLHAIGSDHPLTELIIRCINVDPQQRPHAYDITQELSKMVSRYPASFANRLDMLKRIKEDRQSLGDVTELKKEVDQGEKQLCAQNLEIDKLKAENENLRTRVARNGELVRNTILALQLAQQKRQGHLKLEVQIDSPKVTKKSDQLVKPPVTDDITSPERSTEVSEKYNECV